MRIDELQYDLEKIAFGNFKNRTEKDTEFEGELFLAIREFIRIASPGNKARAQTILKQIQTIKHKYPNDLLPDPKHKFAYRGTQLPSSKYAELLSQVVQYRGYKNKWIKIPYTYTPRSPVQSWSVSLKVAAAFAANGNDYPDSIEYTPYNSKYATPAVIKIPVNDAFVLNAKLTNALAKVYLGSIEHEIIRVDNTPVSATLLVRTSWLVGRG